MGRATHGEILVWQMERGAFDFRAGGFQALSSARSLPPSPVTSLAQTPDGDLWVGTRDAGVFRIGGGKTASIRNGLPDLKVNCLLAGGNRDVWIGTDNGMARWNGSELTTAGIPESFPGSGDGQGSRCQHLGEHGFKRAATLQLPGCRLPEGSDGGSREAITALFEDREGNLWIGSAGGLERLRDSTFVTYSLPEGLPTDGSHPVFVDSENSRGFRPSMGTVVGEGRATRERRHRPGQRRGLLDRGTERRSLAWEATRRTYESAVRRGFVHV
jgi:hypothetical protein